MAQEINVTGTLVIDERAREWCMLPYPGHPHGCPNYGKSVECPPKVGRVAEAFDLSKSHWFIVVAFNLGAHARKMKLAHPQWTARQTRNCLYWQNGVRKKLRSACQELAGQTYTLIPEAMGVDVFRTLEKHGITLLRNPQETVYKVGLCGTGSAAKEGGE